MASENPPKRRPRPDPAGRDFSEQLVDQVVERVAERINEKLNDTLERQSAGVARRVEQLERKRAKAAMKAEVLDRIASRLGALDVWTRTEPAARRPRFTRDEIASAATRIADSEGFAAVSMRRIAAELDAGTMTLYHYVRTKDELLTLVTDAVMGEVVVPPDETIPTDWRAAVTMLAERSRAALQRHPWILDITDDPAIGPNSVRHFDQSIQAVSSLPISLDDKLDIVAMVDEYVFGYCLHHRNNQVSDEQSFDDGALAYVTGLVESGDYPQLEAMTAEYGLEAGWRLIDEHMRDPQRFSRNLARLLDGIEAAIQRR